MVETKYDLEELLKHQEHIITDTEDCKRDADRCADAWKKLYIPYFSQSEFWKDCDFSKSARKGFFEFEDCSISGDVVFNFGKDKKFKKNQKFEYFQCLLCRYYGHNEAQQYLQELEYCNQLNYSIYNMSLMPVTGGLNNFKGINKNMNESNGQKLDRPDKFLFYLNDFYKNKSTEHIIFSNTHGRTSKSGTAEENTKKLKNSLFNFLSKFQNIEDYCKHMYLIDDKEYINCLIKFSQQPIEDGEDVVRYMRLAEQYWFMKYNKIKQSYREH